MKIGFFGLGSMGYGMATSLIRAGYAVWGFDIFPPLMEKFINEGGQVGELKAVASEFDLVVVTVLNAEQTESVLFGDDGIASSLKEKCVVIACATVAPSFARNISARCEALGLMYLDAPISGGAAKAASGQLSIMASGTDDTFIAAKPALDAMAETVFDLGNEAGAGSAMKAVNQLLAGIHIASMAEAMTFGIKQGIEPATIVDVISKCAGTSWMFENRAPHIVEGDYTPRSAVDIWLKDLGIILDIAKETQFGAPLTSAALEQFTSASASGLGKEDDAAVAKIYARNADINLPGVV